MTGLFGKLFKRRAKDPVRDVLSLTSQLAKPAIQVLVQKHASLSHFGGSPGLPVNTPWPEKDGKKLAFLARVSLAEAQRASHIPWLPDTGALLFFYDMDEQPWGFDPRDRGRWAVLHVPDFVDRPADSHGDSESSAIRFRSMGFRRIDSFPPHEREAVASLNLTDEEREIYGEISNRPYQGAPRHQMAGFPSPVQGDGMELQCQLASHGLFCGDESGYKDPRAAALAPDAKHWRLLFQFDSDEEQLKVMWGDCGILYFWVHESAARDGDFSNAWVVLQCC